MRWRPLGRVGVEGRLLAENRRKGRRFVPVK